MLRKKQCVAMLLAGGQGSRLGILTRHTAKPAIPFGGKYRIIDFPVSNCTNSGIDVIGVLTQYRPLELNAYIGNGAPWDLDLNNGGIFVLPPFSTGKEGEWYKGTANSIYQNIEFIEQYNPEYVLVLSGDHIYKMDYAAMLAFHIESEAAVTIAVRQVPWEETNRFGIMNTDENGFITEFEEKPKHAKSNNASMGVYVFTWKLMKETLIADEADPSSTKDFGKNIIPKLLSAGEKLVAYKFSGYWKDVGTIESLWEANMDLLQDPPPIDLHDSRWRIYARNVGMPPHYVGPKGAVTNSLITEGGVVEGDVVGSILSGGVQVHEGSQVKDSVIMPGAIIGKGAVIVRAIIGENSVIGENAVVGEAVGDIAVVGNNTHLGAGEKVAAGVQVGE